MFTFNLFKDLQKVSEAQRLKHFQEAVLLSTLFFMVNLLLSNITNRDTIKIPAAVIVVIASLLLVQSMENELLQEQLDQESINARLTRHG